jgi:hypothetical protein
MKKYHFDAFRHEKHFEKQPHRFVGSRTKTHVRIFFSYQ